MTSEKIEVMLLSDLLNFISLAILATVKRVSKNKHGQFGRVVVF
jgi:hypothetical protein